MSDGLRLGAIWIYPVKSLPGVRVASATVGRRGLEGDRRYMVVDPDGRFLTQRERPRLAALRAQLTATGVRVSLPDGRAVDAGRDGAPRRVIVWSDTVEAVDAGDAPAALLTEHLGQPARLVYMPDEARRPTDAADRDPDDVVSFADGYPFLVTTTASLRALNERLDAPVDQRRFRPNLVVDGAAAFDEDGWRGLTIGDVRFRCPKPCDRCSVVDVDPDRAAPDRRVLAELARFRRRGNQVWFGLNLVHANTGRLEVGMPIEARSA